MIFCTNLNRIVCKAFKDEIKSLKKLVSQQEQHLGKVIKEEKAGLDKLIKTLNGLNI